MLSATPATNWEFYNWTASSGLNLVNASSENALLRNIQSNGTVTAGFTIDTFTVTVNSGANGIVTPTQPQKVVRGGSFGITATGNSRYHFYKWTKSSGITITDTLSSNTSVVNVQTDGSVTAVFAPDTYSVTVGQVPSGAGSMPSVGTQKLAYGTELTLTAEPNAGYAFTGWSITRPGSMEYVAGNADSSTVTVRVLDSGTINANFSGVTYTVQVSSSNNRYGAVSPGIQQVSYNGSFTVIASVKRGCRFVEWVVDSGIMTVDDRYNDTTSVNSVLSDGKIRGVFELIPGDSGVVYVDSASTLPVNEQDGKCWYTAYADLQTALNAGANKEVWVAKGAYSPSTTSPFTPVSFSKIYGGFDGTEVIRDERDFVANRTVLDAGYAVTTLSLDKKEKITVDGFILTGAKPHGYNIFINLVQDSLCFVNCIVNNKNQEAYGGVDAYADSRDKVVLFLNCIFTKIRSCNCVPIFLSKLKTTFVNTIICDNTIDNNNGISGAIGVFDNGILYFIHSAMVNNVAENAFVPEMPNALYKEEGSTIEIYNSVIWNDSTHSINNRPLLYRVDSTDHDLVQYCTIDSLKVYKRIFRKDGVTWMKNKDADPHFVNLSEPGGTNDEYWFTSNCGLIYSQDKPGVDDGESIIIDYNWLKWDIRGNGFVRWKVLPDIGPFEKQ